MTLSLTAFSLQLVLTLTFFTHSSIAAPVPRNLTASSLPASLVIAALVLGFLFLICLKRVYVRNRRVKSTQDSSSTASADDSMTSHSEKSGFFAGFFGSPALEIQSALEKKEETGSKNSSFASQVHTDTRLPRIEYPSVLDITLRRNQSLSNPPAMAKKTALQETHLPELLPSLPGKAYIAHIPSRRLSLPTTSQRVTHDTQRRRHSSLKSQRSTTRSPSVRIVDRPPSLDPPLPVSPLFCELPNVPPAASSPFSPKPGSRLSRLFIPPLPPLPSTQSSPSPVQRSGSLQISHPYALSLYPRKHTTPSETDNLLSTRQPVKSQVSVANQSPSTLPSSCPSPPPMPPSILKPKSKPRARRSPSIGPIGPSPLRTMILPESPNSDLSSHAPFKDNSEGIDPHSLRRPYAAYRTSGMYAGVIRGTPQSTDKRASQSRRSSTVDEDDPGALFGIIRELVEETCDWDPNSVFMSDSFKDLLGITGTDDFVVGTREELSGIIESGSDRSRSADIGLEFSDETSAADYLISFWEESSGEREVGLAC